MDIHWWWLLGIYVYYLDRQTAAVGQTSNRTHLVHAARESASVYNMHALNGTLCGHVFCVPRRLQFACAIWKHLLLETCHNERGGRVANTLWARFFFFAYVLWAYAFDNVTNVAVVTLQRSKSYYDVVQLLHIVCCWYNFKDIVGIHICGDIPPSGCACVWNLHSFIISGDDVCNEIYVCTFCIIINKRRLFIIFAFESSILFEYVLIITIYIFNVNFDIWPIEMLTNNKWSLIIDIIRDIVVVNDNDRCVKHTHTHQKY